MAGARRAARRAQEGGGRAPSWRGAAGAGARVPRSSVRLLANLANLAVGKQEEELSRAVAIQGHPAGAPFGARHDASEGEAWRALMEGIAVKVRRPLMTLVDEPR